MSWAVWPGTSLHQGGKSHKTRRVRRDGLPGASYGELRLVGMEGTGQENAEALGGVEASGQSKQGLLDREGKVGWLQKDWGENPGVQLGRDLFDMSWRPQREMSSGCRIL